jgi:hypothetical protein
MRKHSPTAKHASSRCAAHAAYHMYTPFWTELQGAHGRGGDEARVRREWRAGGLDCGESGGGRRGGGVCDGTGSHPTIQSKTTRPQPNGGGNAKWAETKRSSIPKMTSTGAGPRRKSRAVSAYHAAALRRGRGGRSGRASSRRHRRPQGVRAAPRLTRGPPRGAWWGGSHAAAAHGRRCSRGACRRQRRHRRLRPRRLAGMTAVAARRRRLAALPVRASLRCHGGTDTRQVHGLGGLRRRQSKPLGVSNRLRVQSGAAHAGQVVHADHAWGRGEPGGTKAAGAECGRLRVCRASSRVSLEGRSRRGTHRLPRAPRPSRQSRRASPTRPGQCASCGSTRGHPAQASPPTASA